MTNFLEHEIVLNCSAEHAFATFVEKIDLWWPKGHRKFESSKMSCTPTLGGHLLETSASGEQFIFAQVQSTRPPEELVFAWHPGKISLPTTTLIRFSAIAEHETNIHVTHSEGEANIGEHWPARAALFNKGWQQILPALKSFAEQQN